MYKTLELIYVLKSSAEIFFSLLELQIRACIGVCENGALNTTNVIPNLRHYSLPYLNR